MKSVKVLFAFTMILFMAFPAHSFVEPDGFGGYRWGQKFEEFQSMGPLLVDDEDKDLALAVALEAPRSWKESSFQGKPQLYIQCRAF